MYKQHTLIAVIIAACGSAASAQSRDWINAAGGNWSLPANWSLADVPDTAAEVAVIGTPGMYTVTLDLSPTLGGLTISNSAALLTITAGRALANAGTLIQNDGTIRVNTTAGAGGASIRFDNGGLLGGTGTVALNASANTSTAFVHANGPAVTNGAQHTIRGTGRVVGPWVNEGLISADIATRTLALDTGARTNNGVIRAISGGTLLISGDSTAQGPSGRVLADGGGVTLTSTAVSNGTLEAVNGGAVTVTGTSTLTGVTLTGPLGITASSAILGGGLGFTNDGTITVNTTSGAGGALIRFDNGGLLGGTGTVALNASLSTSTASVQSNSALAVTNGAQHTIRGTGRVVGPWINEGLISADVSARTLALETGDRTNNGVMSATGGGTLLISGNSTAQGPSGRVLADGGGVTLTSTAVSNGTLEAVNGGAVTVTGTSTLTGVTLTGPLGITASSAILGGGPGFTNDGTITVNTTSGAGGALIRFDNGGLLGGTGTVALNASASPSTAFVHANGPAITAGPGQAVTGRGQLLGPMTWQGTIAPGTAAAANVIQANGPLTLAPTSKVAIKLGGTAAANFDLLGGTGAKALDGRLLVTLLNGYSPTGLTVYNVITGPSITGKFAELDFPVLAGGRRMHMAYTPTAVRLTACSADWNVDAAVNSSDISAFLTSWLASVTAPDLTADFNADGVTNSSDISSFLTAWLNAVVNGC